MTVYTAPQGFDPLHPTTEVVTGIVGSTITLENAPVQDLVALYKNGSRLSYGSGLDYTVRDRVITLSVASIAGDDWVVDYYIRPNRGE